MRDMYCILNPTTTHKLTRLQTLHWPGYNHTLWCCGAIQPVNRSHEGLKKIKKV